MTFDMLERCAMCHDDVDIEPPLYDSRGRPFCTVCAGHHEEHGDDD